jgi:hypothetical protein
MSIVLDDPSLNPEAVPVDVSELEMSEELAAGLDDEDVQAVIASLGVRPA